VLRGNHIGIPDCIGLADISCESHGTALLATAEKLTASLGLVDTACRSHGSLMLANCGGQ
jgi:hypothetical protein